MSHSLFRLLEKSYNVPHLITQEALAPILDYLLQRSKGGIPSFMGEQDIKKASDKKPEQVGGIGEILIDGALTYKPVYGECSDGPTGVSYKSILHEARELIKMGVDTIILTHSSPGGEAMQAFATAAELRAMCDESNIKLISYIDTMSASASYLLACVADEVVIHPEAKAGSIGCVCCIFDYSKALSNAGIKPIYIASTPGKSGMNEDSSFSDDFIAELQAEVSALGLRFAQHVEKYTGVDVNTILKMDAKMFSADKALENGLVNAVMDHREFAKYLVDKKGS